MAKEHVDFSVKTENFELLKEKLYKSIKESEETELDPLFKVGNIVTIGTTEDDDLNDFLDELGNPEIVITSIEDDYFWGETLDGQSIEYHMEYKDISSIRSGEEKISVKVTSVDWDTDEEEDLKNLPQEFELEINHYPSNELDDEVSDAISDKYGFTHLGFNYIVETLNESLLDDVENLEKFYAPDLKDSESLDNIWTLLEWTDNMNSEDGKTLCKYTKIGLIDTINDEIRTQAEEAEDFEPEQLERTATNKEILCYLEYLPTEAKLVSISNYDINNLYDEPHLPKGE